MLAGMTETMELMPLLFSKNLSIQLLSLELLERKLDVKECCTHCQESTSFCKGRKGLIELQHFRGGHPIAIVIAAQEDAVSKTLLEES